MESQFSESPSQIRGKIGDIRIGMVDDSSAWHQSRKAEGSKRSWLAQERPPSYTKKGAHFRLKEAR